jgi:hypothetical protein
MHGAEIKADDTGPAPVNRASRAGEKLGQRGAGSGLAVQPTQTAPVGRPANLRHGRQTRRAIPAGTARTPTVETLAAMRASGPGHHRLIRERSARRRAFID